MRWRLTWLSTSVLKQSMANDVTFQKFIAEIISIVGNVSSCCVWRQCNVTKKTATEMRLLNTVLNTSSREEDIVLFIH